MLSICDPFKQFFSKYALSVACAILISRLWKLRYHYSFFIKQCNTTTPNYPNAYPNSYACSWVIDVEPGATVQFMIDVFDLEIGYDTLEVSSH